LVVGWGFANELSTSTGIYSLFIGRVLLKVSFVVRFYSRIVLAWSLDAVRVGLDKLLLKRFLMAKNASLVFEAFLDKVALTNICLYY